MSDAPPKDGSRPQGAEGVRPSGLPPTLCNHCRFGAVQRLAQPLHGADEEDFWLRETGAVAVEFAACANPRFGGRPGDPVDIEDVVMSCEGFQARPLKTM